MKIILSVLLLSLTVLVHEYGHYVAMRACGVRVTEFAVGVGPTLYERTLEDGTVFKVKPILVGGYTEPATNGPGSIARASLGSLVVIDLGGMLAGVLAATVCLVLLRLLGASEPAFVAEYGLRLPGPLQPLLMPALLWLATPVLLVRALVRDRKAFVRGMSGPIGIVDMGRTRVESPAAALRFFVFLNVVVSGFNLLPLAPLDGGQVVVACLSRVDGTAAALYAAGSMALMVLVTLVAFSRDILRLLPGGNRSS